MDAEAIEEIRGLKARYVRCVDLKLWSELGELLTEDATADYGTRSRGAPERLDGRQAVLDYLRGVLDNDIATSHLLGSHEIHVDGDTATGTWSFQDKVLVPAHGVIVEGAAYYEDRYARGADGTWRIASTGYTRLYEHVQSMDQLPGFHLLVNRWSERAASGGGESA